MTTILDRLEKSNDIQKKNYITVLQTPDLIKTSVDQFYYQCYFKSFLKEHQNLYKISSA